MNRLSIFCACAAIGFGTHTFAATDLDALLKEVQSAQQQSNQINNERERRFIKNKSEQAALLRKARAQLGPVESRTNTLRSRFSSLQSELQTLSKQLNEKAGDLNQLVAVVRQAAGDLQAVAGDSLVTAQFPEREDVLTQMTASGNVPTAQELGQLWYLLQQEMTETGRVVTFKSPVIANDGSTTERDVTRVGPFVAVAGDEFLQYLPGAGLKSLSRQPGYRERNMAQELQQATAGVVPMAIDPTRGNILELLVEKPGLAERIKQGGGVGYVIIFLGIAGLILAILQFVKLLDTRRRVQKQLKVVGEPNDKNPLGRVLAAGQGVDVEDAEGLELKLDEAVMREVPALQRGQGLIKLLSAVAPLMGLLGTVVGMIATFQAITLFGTGDPKLMAGGISQALVTTVLGLVVAIPLLFLHSLLSSRSRSVIQVLEEQSAGLLARYIESRQQSRHSTYQSGGAGGA